MCTYRRDALPQPSADHQAEQRSAAGEIESLIQGGNQWVKFVPNQREISMRELTPTSITGGLQVGVGRVRKLNMGPSYVSAVCGAPVAAGAAESLRRMLRILQER